MLPEHLALRDSGSSPNHWGAVLAATSTLAMASYAVMNPSKNVAAPRDARNVAPADASPPVSNASVPPSADGPTLAVDPPPFDWRTSVIPLTASPEQLAEYKRQARDLETLGDAPLEIGKPVYLVVEDHEQGVHRTVEMCYVQRGDQQYLEVNGQPFEVWYEKIRDWFQGDYRLTTLELGIKDGQLESFGQSSFHNLTSRRTVPLSDVRQTAKHLSVRNIQLDQEMGRAPLDLQREIYYIPRAKPRKP